MRPYLKVITCLILVYALGISCSNDRKECSKEANQVQRPINPNGDSELALLMREMYDEVQQIKEKIDSDDSIVINLDHKKILTAHATEPKKAASEEYKAFAKTYLQTIESLKTASLVQREKIYDSVVNNCMTCHKALCPGPMVRIKKLR